MNGDRAKTFFEVLSRVGTALAIAILLWVGSAIRDLEKAVVAFELHVTSGFHPSAQAKADAAAKERGQLEKADLVAEADRLAIKVEIARLQKRLEKIQSN